MKGLEPFSITTSKETSCFTVKTDSIPHLPTKPIQVIEIV